MTPTPEGKATPEQLAAAKAAWLAAPPTVTSVGGLLELAINAALTLTKPVTAQEKDEWERVTKIGPLVNKQTRVQLEAARDYLMVGLDFSEFDGDRRGIGEALGDAEDKLREALSLSVPSHTLVFICTVVWPDRDTDVHIFSTAALRDAYAAASSSPCVRSDYVVDAPERYEGQAQ